MLRQHLVLALFAALVALSACSRGESTAPDQAPPSSDPPATSTTVPFDPTSALLELSDLPSGSRAIAERTDAMELVRRGLFRQEVCGEVVGSPEDLVAGRYSSFDVTATSPPLDIVNHGVFDLAGSAAEARQEQYRQVASSCTEKWSTTGNGITVEFEVLDELQLPDLGFPATGFELSYQEQGQPVAREWFVMMRSGGILSSVIVVAPAGTDQSYADEIFERAADRLRAARGG